MISPLGFLRAHLSPNTRPRRVAAGRRKPRRMFGLEVLEQRLCMATDIWTGAGAAAGLAHPNDNWSNPQNWQAEVAPLPGDVLDFPAASVSKIANDDYAPGTRFASIQFEGSNYQLRGNLVQLQDGVINRSGFNTIALPITLAASQTFSDSSGSGLVLSGALNNGGYLWTVNADGTVLFNGTAIGGSGGLTVTGNAKFVIADTSPDTYTGVTTVAADTLYLDGQDGDAVIGNLVVGDGIGSNESDVVRLGLGNQIAPTSSVTIAWTGLLDLNGFNQTVGPLTMSGGNITTGTGTLTLGHGLTTQAASTAAIITGNLFLGTGSTPQTFTVASGTATDDLIVKATVSGGPGVELIKAGAGTMQLVPATTDGNTYSGPTLVSAGTLVAAAADALGATTAGVTVDSGATLVYQDPNIDSNAVFAAYPLTLDGGTLKANGNAPIVTAPGPITLAADCTIEDGSGTTLVLPGQITGPGGFTKVWAGALDLGHANNEAGATVVSGGVLALDNANALGAGGVKVSAQSTLDLANGLVYPSESLALAGTLDVNGSATWTGPVNLTGPALVEAAAGGTLTLSGPITGAAANTLTIGAAGSSGTVVFSGANSYAGTTAVSVGTLAIANADALGSPTAKGTNGGTTVAAGATLQLEGGVSSDPTESLTLNGAGVDGAGALLVAGGKAAWNGPISLATSTTIGANVGAIMTINGVISGPSTSNLTIVGGGTVVLAGADTFEGYTKITAGTVALENATALGGAPLNGGAGTTVEFGATLELEGGITYAIEPLSLNGAGVGGTAGALESLTGNNTWSGPIKLNSAATITSAAGSTLSDNIQIANEGYLLTINAAGNVNLGTTISGAGGLTKTGAGTLTFSTAAPTLYTGPTLVAAGTLLLAKPASIVAITGAGVTIAPGATLAGTGLITTSVINDGLVSPGGQGTVGTLTIDGNYSQAATGVLDVDLASTKTFDQVVVNGVATLDGTLNVSLPNGFQPPHGARFPILTFHSSSGKFRSVNLPPGLSILYDAQDVTLVSQ